MASHRNWSEDEITVACYIYIYSDKVTVKEKRLLSSMFNRTEKAISAKMDNIARFDEQAILKGRAVFTHGSILDEVIWNRFQEDPESMVARAKGLMLESGLIDEEVLSRDYPVIDTDFVDIGPGEERSTMMKVRINQNSFRRAVLSTSLERCCITGIRERSSLVASHIKPWSKCTPDEKTDIHNALCINAMHDCLFDKFLMTIDEQDNIIYAPNLEKSFGEEYFESSIAKYDKIHVNDINRPGIGYIHYHNSIFEKRTGLKIR